jgi:transposase
MRRFVEGIDREQATLFPECLEDWIDQDNPVRAIDAFVDKLDLPEWDSMGLLPRPPAGLPIIHRDY